MDDDLWEPDYDDIDPVWTDEEIADQIEDIFDEHREAIFRSKVRAWSQEHWIPAELRAHRVGSESRSLQDLGQHAPSVVWAATCAEIILRDLTMKPIFVGLFLGSDWAEEVARSMVRRRWQASESRRIAKAVLKTVAGLDVDIFEHLGRVVWKEIPALLDLRHRIVHEGAQADEADSHHGLDTINGLYVSVLPRMRGLCGVTEMEGYVPPEASA